MNTKDLMVGDWVAITEPDDFHGYIGKVVIINGETGYITVHISNMHLHDVFVEDLQPILISSEILEKNNDILYGELPILFDDGKMHYSIIECRYVSKEYERNNETFYCLLSSCAYNGDSFITPIAKIRYVHELQHTLKLCEIEKEIVL